MSSEQGRGGRDGTAPSGDARGTLDLGPPVSSAVAEREETGDLAEPDKRPASDGLPELIGDHYRVDSLLGRGGAASVYAVTDLATGKQLALKQLTVRGEDRQGLVPLFEREFHMLAQLSHPSVIEVYDYAVDARAPYYTMELLQGGDLRELAPAPWREVCALLYDVCSSLALLHSRRLLHRDIGPRNIRRTEHGTAKLIDFGAMVPMGPASQLVGTPPFVPPEALERGALDARTDLYALGATFYYALTRHTAYPARDFASLPRAWASKPPLPSSMVSDIPPALDELVMSLLSLEPALRPRSAFEVMERLSAVAGLARSESEEVSRAYLSTPVLVGREGVLDMLRVHLRRMLEGSGGVTLIEGPEGIGRSRLLDACALEGKTLGATVLHAAAGLGDDTFAAAQVLGGQLLDVSSSAERASMRADALESVLLVESEQAERAVLRTLSSKQLDRADTQRALARWFLRVSKTRPLLLLVDDVQALDDASVAMLAALANGADERRLSIVVALESGAVVRAPKALAVLRSRGASLLLDALDKMQTTALLESVFGDVPHLTLLSTRVHAVARGNPRTCMELAQHLVDRSVVRYANGAWLLPERLPEDALPTSGADAYAKKITSLSALARFFLETQALTSQGAFTRDQYIQLAASEEPREVDAALSELVSQDLLSSDGRLYRLRHRGLAGVVTLDAEARAERHRALAALYASDARVLSALDDRSRTLLSVQHLLLAREPERALDRMRDFIVLQESDPKYSTVQEDALMSLEDVARVYMSCFEAAEQFQRPARELHNLRKWLLDLSVPVDDSYYRAVAPDFLAQLRHDSGLALWEEMTDLTDEGARLTAALTKAFERYNALPEHERVYRPDEAIKYLVRFVAVSIAIGAGTLDLVLLRSLPDLLAPFRPLSKVLDTMYRNVLATRESTCFARSLSAREMWLDAYAGLADIAGEEVQYVGFIRSAIAFAIGAVEAALGMTAAVRWAEVLDADPLQRVNGVCLRRVMALQQGNRELAESCRKRADVLAVQTSTRQMFKTLLSVELSAHAHSGDLAGVRECRERITALCTSPDSPWNAYRYLADGFYERLRGDHAAALTAFELGLSFATPDEAHPRRALILWPRLVASRAETLIRLGREQEAEAFVGAALARWHELKLELGGHELKRALALAEGKLGRYAQAGARLDALIEEQKAFGIAGINLGASYEARTRIAIWAGDVIAVEENGRCTAREYRHGRNSPLGARYERLMEEARLAGMSVLPQLSAFETKLSGSLGVGAAGSAATRRHVEQHMKDATSAEERAQRAVQMMCEARDARAGHLFLRAPGGGVRLAGSFCSLGAGSAEPPDEVLRKAMGDYFQAHAIADDTRTAVLSTNAALMPGTTMAYARDRGVAYLPVLLSVLHDGELIVAGVLALELGESGASPMSTTPLIEALVAHLASCGDVPGIDAEEASSLTQRR